MNYSSYKDCPFKNMKARVNFLKRKCFPPKNTFDHYVDNVSSQSQLLRKYILLKHIVTSVL